MKKLLHFSILILLCMSSACNLNQAAFNEITPGPAAWIDAPLDGSSLPLAEYDVVSHASDPSGITSFELSVNGSVFHTDAAGGDQAGQTIAHIQQAWLPAAPGTYLLSLRAANAQGVFGPYAYAHVTVGRVVAQPPTSSPTATITATPTATLTPTPSAPSATGLQNTNCHNGPSGSFKNSGTLFTGQTVIIEGISADKSWIWVRHPNFDKGDCWLYLPLVQVNGSLDGLPVVKGPALPPPPGSGGSSSSSSAATGTAVPPVVPSDTPEQPPPVLK